MAVDKELYNLLRKSEFFRDYANKEINKLYRYFSWNSYIEGEVIYKENEIGNEMSMLLYGEAKVSTIKDYRRLDLALLKEGDILGETSVLVSQPRFATVIAYTNCELSVISEQSFKLLIKNEKNIALKFSLQLLKIMATRFRESKVEIKQNILKEHFRNKHAN